MEEKNYTPLIKFSINCFKYSLIIGTILYASYILTQNSDLFYWGFMYVVLAVILNSITLLGLIITFFFHSREKNRNDKNHRLTTYQHPYS